jgi:hypothetical protein
MNDAFWAMLMRPFLAFFFLAFICLPVRFAVKRWAPEGRLKRWLLTDIKKARQ